MLTGISQVIYLSTQEFQILPRQLCSSGYCISENKLTVKFFRNTSKLLKAVRFWMTWGNTEIILFVQSWKTHHQQKICNNLLPLKVYYKNHNLFSMAHGRKKKKINICIIRKSFSMTFDRLSHNRARRYRKPS